MGGASFEAIAFVELLRTRPGIELLDMGAPRRSRMCLPTLRLLYTSCEAIPHDDGYNQKADEMMFHLVGFFQV